MKAIKTDPKMFISSPYIKCPKCGKESFGILMICDHHYCRRCRECFYPRGTESSASYPLPKLDKKIIYVDQFAISNMMKSLNPQTKAYQKGRLDGFWIRLFERLDSLCKLQLIICPVSDFHTNESLLSPYFEPLKRMYKLLSQDVSFCDCETIKSFQIYDHAMNWISGKEEKQLKLDVHSIVYGNINAWQDKLTISVNLQYGPDWIDDLKKTREKIHKGLSEIFRQWQSEKNKTFDDWFEKESMDFGRLTAQIYLKYRERFAQISQGQVELTRNDMVPVPSVTLVHSIRDAFKRTGIQDHNIWSKIGEYLASSSLKNIPFVKISSMLYASLARKAANGRKKRPNQGMVNDIAIISALLPYCDAMFIDNECHAYLKEQPLCDAIAYGTAIFSQNTRVEFLNYLDKIELKATREHLDKVNEVYGKSWRDPYKTLYKEKSGRLGKS